MVEPDNATTAPAVERLTVRHARAAASALAASHGDYPAFRAVFPDPRRRRRALPAFFAATVRDGARHGTVLAVRDGAEVAAVAVWLPPGAFPWSTARKLRATPHLLRVALADPRHTATFARYGANAEAAHPATPHWYLVVLGVRPTAQGRRLGSALVRAGLELADRDGAACRLETSDPANTAFYERFGFAVVDPALRLVPGGPAHVAMRRDARAATTRQAPLRPGVTSAQLPADRHHQLHETGDAERQQHGQ